MRLPAPIRIGDKAAPSHSKGFTLVELLVVIAIIVVLAGLSIQVGQRAIIKAKKVATLAVCTELEQAVTRFYDDNSTMPLSDLDGDTEPDTPIDSNDEDGLEILRVLMNKEDDDTSLNTKGIKYLALQQGDKNRNGVILDTDNEVVGLYDPWGNSYFIILDGDFDEEIEIPEKGGSNVTNLQRRVAVWSDGAEPSNGKVRDNVKTW